MTAERVPTLPDVIRNEVARLKGAGFHLAPVVERLAEHLKTSTKLFMDETTAPVLDRVVGGLRTVISGPWRGMTEVGAAMTRRVWSFSMRRIAAAGENAEKLLTGFDGALQIPSCLQANHCRAADGYTGYNRPTKLSRKGGEPITVAYRWAHARRKLKEIFDRDGSEIAAEGLRQIAEIYPIE